MIFDTKFVFIAKNEEIREFLLDVLNDEAHKNYYVWRVYENNYKTEDYSVIIVQAMCPFSSHLYEARDKIEFYYFLETLISMMEVAERYDIEFWVGEHNENSHRLGVKVNDKYIGSLLSSNVRFIG